MCHVNEGHANEQHGRSYRALYSIILPRLPTRRPRLLPCPGRVVEFELRLDVADVDRAGALGFGRIVANVRPLIHCKSETAM